MVINGQRVLIVLTQQGYETYVGGVFVGGGFPTKAFAEEVAAYAASEMADRRRRHVQQVA